MLQLKFYRRVKEYCRKITWTAGEQDLTQLALRHDRYGFSAFRKVWGLLAAPVGERSVRGLALIIIFAWAPAKLSPTRLWGSKLHLNQQILNRNVLVHSYKYGVHHFFWVIFFDGGKLPSKLILEMNRSLKGHTDSWRQEWRGMGRDQLRMGKINGGLNADCE